MQVANSAKRMVAICLSVVLVLQGLIPSPSAFAETVANAATPSQKEATDASSPSSDATLANDETAEEDGNTAILPNGQDSSDDAEADDNAAVDPVEPSSQEDTAAADSGASAQSTDVSQLAEGDYAFKTAGELAKAFTNGSKKYGAVAVEGDKVTDISVTDPYGFNLISNADPSLYEDASISVSGYSGDTMDLTSSSTYSFQGIGSKEHPFKGSFSSEPLKIDHTLFNGIQLSNSNGTVNVRWAGAPDYAEPIIASCVTGYGTLSATVSIDDPARATSVTESTAAISSALLGVVAGSVSVSATYSFAAGSTRKGVSVVSSSDNAGLIANTVESGSLTISCVSLPRDMSNPTVTAKQNAGGLVGASGLSESGTATESGAIVILSGDIDVSKFEVKGGNTSGGLIGRANKLTLNLPAEGSRSVKPALKVGYDNRENGGSLYAGGVVGYASLDADLNISSSALDFDDSVLLSVNYQKEGSLPCAGGLFGLLNIGQHNVSVSAGTYKSSLVSGLDNQGNRGRYGGLVGELQGAKKDDGSLFALTVSGETEIEFALSGSDDTKKLFYAGGVAGYVGSGGNVAAVVLNGVSVTCKSAGRADNGNCKFGGAIGVLDTDSVLDARGLTVSTADGVEIGGNGGAFAGVVGSSWLGIIRFSGVTDLSNAAFKASNNVAQLVYENFNSLIFASGSGGDGNASAGNATGWKYIRPTEDVELDDIYSYGQVIRLGGNLSSDFITLDETTHKWGIKGNNLTKTGDEYVLSGTEDFAKLAITWQTSGYFSKVNGVTGNNISNITSSTIKLTSNVDLTGTGITGLTKDRAPLNHGGVNEDNHLFAGTLDGDSHEITLSVGEPFGWRNGEAIGPNDASAGNGNVYRHVRLGLFMGVKGATIKNVTVGGSIRFNDKDSADVGPFAAMVQDGNGEETTVSNSTFKTSITYSSKGNDGKVAHVGGVIGSVASGKVTFKDSVANATISSTAKESDDKSTWGDSNVGGAIGLVSAASTAWTDGAFKVNSTSTINANGLTIKGSITDKAGECIAASGGFIGVIEEKNACGDSSAYKASAIKVNISKLAFDDFSLISNVSDAPAGGLLGYSWGNADVTFGGGSNSDNNYALSVSNSSVTADGALLFGGLVYAASGKWTVNNYGINLNGSTFKASMANKVGMLVCLAGKDLRIGRTDGRGYNDNLSGLYLLDTAPWDTAYLVASASVSTSATCFDEWVADTVGNDSAITASETNGVVSLSTGDRLLNMSGVVSDRNSYNNRTQYGQNNQQTNVQCRYYYNLDKALAEVTSAAKLAGSWLQTPNELLLWSACKYAAPNIRDYVVDQTQYSYLSASGEKYIGSTDATNDGASIDMTGYSYYPVDMAGTNLTVKNVTLKFCYEAIKAGEEGNKPNSDKTQHMNMHAGLIRNFITGTDANVTLSVESVTLAGTVGIHTEPGANTDVHTSGALVCGNVTGYATNSKIATVKIDGLTLDGLCVSNAQSETFAPLLVANMTTFANLDVKSVGLAAGDKYKNEDDSYKVAATSLFGNLGSSNADMVSATFETVAVPSAKPGEDGKSKSIFAHASLLESFAYGEGKTGSGVYTFTQADRNYNKVTYGKEIDSQGGEYEGLQLWYYDENVHNTDDGLVQDNEIPSHKASQTSPAFGFYLPYVYKGKTDTDATSHEIKVNQRIANLRVGCGTYGDPYTVRTAEEVYAITEYINTKKPMDGWEITIAKDQEALCTRRSNNLTDNEATYRYNSGSGMWTLLASSDTEAAAELNNEALDELENETMHRYLQSAYYSIEPKDIGDTTGTQIELDGDRFVGFGNATNPFRGVIVGNLKKDAQGYSQQNMKLVIVKGKQSIQGGLVPYSYGSVVKDLNIEYSAPALSPNLIDYKPKDGNGVPTAFFGGVIGCVLGGDNIVDDVSVNAANQFTVSGYSLSGHANLVPIGGYVGAIAGGGVIFRNMGASVNWHTDATSLYDNPYVGRVIDGFAFSEDCEISNGITEDSTTNGLATSSYKVNQLNTHDTACVTTTGMSSDKYRDSNNPSNEAPITTVHDAQGLLVLSAIINSGAGAGASATEHEWFGKFYGSRAYQGYNGNPEANNARYKFGNNEYGKVRNSTYTSVGQVDNNNEANYKAYVASVSDDRLAPGNQKHGGALDRQDGDKVNSPYLVAAYATDWQTGYVCAADLNGMVLQFEGDNKKTYDMTGYGSGFLGLSGRYYSNACVSGDKTTDRDRIVPRLACIKGNNATVKITNTFKEYTNDDYKVQAVGGLFGFVEFTNDERVKDSIQANENAVVSNLDFANSTVSLQRLNADGTTVNPSGSFDSNNDVKLGVGVLAGATANWDSLEASGRYVGVALSDCTVKSPDMAGGLLGSSGWNRRSTDDSDGFAEKMIEKGESPGGNSFPGVSPVKLYNCTFSNLTVEGFTRAGGFVGAAGGNGSVTGVWVTDETKSQTGSSSTITSTGRGSTAGGMVGLAWSQVQVNVSSGNSQDSYQTASFSNVRVLNTGASGWIEFTGTGGIVGNPTRGCDINKISVSFNEASDKNVSVGGSNLKGVGGIIGYIEANASYSVKSATVTNAYISSSDSAGGVLGHLRNGRSITCDDVTVDGATFTGSYCGGVLGSISAASSNIAVTNSAVKNTTFEKESSGGISGDGRGGFSLANILVSNVSQTSDKKNGILLGETAVNQVTQLYAAGLDIVPPNGKSTSNLPEMFGVNGNVAVRNEVHKKSFIAFADYGDEFESVAADGLYSDEVDSNGSMVPVVSTSPYVTTNPKSAITVKDTEDSNAGGKYLFGDGAAIDTAATIRDEAGTEVADKYTYTNIGGISESGGYQNANEYSASSASSTYNTNNADVSKKVLDSSDFPVLLVSGNDTHTVTDYLNIVTNGGFSDAVRLNGGTQYVTAKAEMFELNDGSFVRSSDPASLNVVHNGDALMSFRASSDWDNDKGRFTLLTVTFNAAGQQYRVQVPIIVKRMLEIDFTATYADGTNFNSSYYDSLGGDAHVLSSFDEPMTGYLTWTYNSAEGKLAEYGWDTYLASGGTMKPLAKSLLFSGSEDSEGKLPQNTQLTLIDTAHNNKEYHYEVTDEAGASSVSLSSFVDANNSKLTYKDKWLSEIMEVSASEDSTNGVWVKCGENDNPGAKDANGDYYRVATKDDNETKYKLTVAKDTEAKETMPSESFYLIVRVPSGSGQAVNGFTSTDVSTDVSKHINYMLRPEGAGTDSHGNTASTYSIYSNYQQYLQDNTKGSSYVEMATVKKGVSYDLPMDVTDTITFDTNQEYNSNDGLFYQLTSSLQQFKNNIYDAAGGWPTGVSGTAKFYVSVAGQSYQWKGVKWEPCSDGVAATDPVSWSSNGGEMKLTMNQNLAGIREIARTKSKDERGKATITVRTVIEPLTMSELACQAGIAAGQLDAAKNFPSAYTKMQFRANLATSLDMLSTSSVTQNLTGNVGYYREHNGGSTIELSASLQSQLGINVNDLALANGTIGVYGTYDLSDMVNADEVIDAATEVRYTLKLQKRTGTASGAYTDVPISNQFVVMESALGKGDSSGDGKSIVFTDKKNSDGSFATYKGAKTFQLPFTVKVNTDVEANNFTYANYRLVLSAELFDGKDAVDKPSNKAGNSGYPYSDYITYTLSKINTAGISHNASN